MERAGPFAPQCCPRRLLDRNPLGSLVQRSVMSQQRGDLLRKIFQEVPPIPNLLGLGLSFLSGSCIFPTALSTDAFDGRMLFKPGDRKSVV